MSKVLPLKSSISLAQPSYTCGYVRTTGDDCFFWMYKEGEWYDRDVDGTRWIPSYGLEDIDGMVQRGTCGPVFDNEDDLFEWAKTAAIKRTANCLCAKESLIKTRLMFNKEKE